VAFCTCHTGACLLRWQLGPQCSAAQLEMPWRPDGSMQPLWFCKLLLPPPSLTSPWWPTLGAHSLLAHEARDPACVATCVLPCVPCQEPLVAAGRLLEFEVRRPGSSPAVLELLAAEYGQQVGMAGAQCGSRSGYWGLKGQLKVC
jgi:hypothetical protein